jgi:hypothetical protein
MVMRARVGDADGGQSLEEGKDEKTQLNKEPKGATISSSAEALEVGGGNWRQSQTLQPRISESGWGEFEGGPSVTTNWCESERVSTLWA